MGIFSVWRGVKALRAVAQAANEAEAERSQAPGPAPRGLAAGLGNVMAQALAPSVQARSEVRGEPLRGSEPQVVSGTAWREPAAAQEAALRARDAAFSVASLEDFAVQVAAAVSATWAGGEPGAVRMVMGDALWEPFAAAVTQYRSVDAKRAAKAGAGGRGTAAPERLGHPFQEGRPTAARLTGLHAGQWYYSARLTVHVTLRQELQAMLEAAPAQERAELAARFHGADITQWDEDWLFQRSAQPGGDPMIEPPACPACGASTRTDGQGRCLHCQQQVPFLTTGWLAAMITSHHPLYAMVREEYARGLAGDPELAARRLKMLARLNPRLAEQVAGQAGIDPRTLPDAPR
jgi:hypothetical protein